ncbi:MAG: hypothetical protein M1829_000835 [Trizodia sp. TS-e1964]|nr:MAG: hypothetical protein M1829_000835 [Trizodia sp. TS-e1964]
MFIQVRSFQSTNVKPDNVFVNYTDSEVGFSDVQLGDFGGTYPADSKYAKEGTPIGASMWTGPEVIMETPWNTATDICLIYGGNFNLFRPRTIPCGHEQYELEVLKRQFQYFGPFPVKYEEIASQETVTAILYLMHKIPCAKTRPFRRTMERERVKRAKEFIGKIMMMDWRDKPTVKELLEDEWFKEDGMGE